jgi:hypothetical protein
LPKLLSINFIFDFFTKCLQSTEILNITGFTEINRNNFLQVCPLMLYNFEINHCEYDDGDVGLGTGEGINSEIQFRHEFYIINK